jgi:hypothetical protein
MLVEKFLTNSILVSVVENRECLTFAISLKHKAAFAFIEEQVGDGILTLRIKKRTSTISLFSKYSLHAFGT